MVEDRTSGTTKINRPVIILIVGIAALVGLAPALFALGRPKILIYSTVLALLIATLSLFRIKRTSEVSPHPFLFLLSGIGALSLISMTGLYVLLFYALIYGVSWLVTFVVSWLGVLWTPNLDAIAFYPTIIIVGLMGIAFIVLAVETIIKQLYPVTAGAKHAFYEFATDRRSALIRRFTIAIVILVIIIVLLILIGKARTIFYILLQISLLYVGFPLILFGKRNRQQYKRRFPVTTRAVQAFSRLFKTAGYEVITSPRTGDAAMDPLLAGLDLFVYSEERALAVNIKHARVDKAPVTWTDALEVRSAARIFGRAKLELEIKAKIIEPVLILIGVNTDETLGNFTKKESIRLVELDDKEVSEILDLKDESELQNKVVKLFGQISTSQDENILASRDTERNAR